MRQRRFVADASHELRTPVAVIRSKTDLALNTHAAGVCEGVARHQCGGEAERLGHLISDLLALAWGDEGKTVFE